MMWIINEGMTFWETCSHQNHDYLIVELTGRLIDFCSHYAYQTLFRFLLPFTLSPSQAYPSHLVADKTMKGILFFGKGG